MGYTWGQRVAERDAHAGMWETSTVFDATVVSLTDQGVPLDSAVEIALEALWFAGTVK